MKQLTQKLMDGKVQVVEVPTPLVASRSVLVRTAYSVISSGTEGSKVRAARKSLLGKARERPDQARQMLELLRRAGPVQAYRTFSKKLKSYSPLGYSLAGTVVAVGDAVTGLAVGDKVACGGAGACHAEVVAVPQNLCVKLAADADLKAAAYNTLGAIALQGVRQADLRLGESCAVIGLGLLGQLTCQLLKAGGLRVVGIDINPRMVDLARTAAVDLAAVRSEPGLTERILELTGGLGLDAAILTAATNSTDPINFAGKILRKKGRVVVVGAVPTGFDREPHYYQKELDLRMSCSYGPGRHDPIYEDSGIDYPPAYVRWTERRNMEAFQDLLYRKKIDVDYLTTHVFGVREAENAYRLITESEEHFVGVLIQFDDATSTVKRVPLREVSHRAGASTVGVSFVGAGSYAASHLLPNLPNQAWLRRRSVLTATGLTSRSIAERFGFECCTSDEADIFEDDEVQVVFVATRHDTHARYVTRSLQTGRHVFVEKPLCINEGELESIAELVSASHKDTVLMPGFNRRFSPLAVEMREELATGPMSMIYRINAGQLAADSWIHDRSIGGGRIVGEVCHFVDFLTFLNGSLPIRLQAFGMAEPGGHDDTISLNISFENGSVGSVCYFANGPASLPKEYVEVYRAGSTAILNDFRELHIWSGGKRAKKRLLVQNKGQAAMVATFLAAVREGAKAPIPFSEVAAVTRATFRAAESLRSGAMVSV